MTRPQRVVCFGECMLELQGTAFGQMQQSYGGDTLNTAVYLARCGRAGGVQVDYATAVGDDALSTGMLQRWQAEGIGTGLVRRLPGRLPGLYLIEVDPHGERRFSYWRGQAAARAYFDTPFLSAPLEAAAGEIDMLYLSGISLAILPPAGRERLAAVAQGLRARGAHVVFDNNYRPGLWLDAAEHLQTDDRRRPPPEGARKLGSGPSFSREAQAAFTRFMGLASIALLTLDDEMALNGEADAQTQLGRTLEHACTEVVVKRGAAPTLVRLAGQPPVEVATERVEHVVDTTAAGDSFAGAYLAARLGGADARAAAAAGNRLAARVVQLRGAVIPRDAMADLVAEFVGRSADCVQAGFGPNATTTKSNDAKLTTRP